MREKENRETGQLFKGTLGIKLPCHHKAIATLFATHFQIRVYLSKSDRPVESFQLLLTRFCKHWQLYALQSGLEGQIGYRLQYITA